MMKKIFILLFTIFLVNIAFAQKRNIAFKNGNIKLIHDLYENMPWEGAKSYSFTSIIYIVDDGKSDTISRADANIRPNPYFDGRCLTFVLDYFEKKAQYYMVFEKKGNKWEQITGQFASNVFDVTATIEQLSIYHTKSSVTKNGVKKIQEKFIDIKARETVIYDIENGKKKNKRISVFSERMVRQKDDDEK